MNKSRVHCWHSQILPPPGKTSTPCATKNNLTDKVFTPAITQLRAEFCLSYS